ncbi:hypothetical protein [Halobaculum limi]|uniref:hypothetical protein n=1 Tax=Halobaculum limi TaxID=3031916 RepID=UPI0024074882|nr:hypothetical protein [Halobaculum sp. YSMS11]
MSDSKWWYGIAIPPALELLGHGGIAALRAFGGLTPGSAPVALGFAFTVVIGLLLIPVFAGSLFFDARAVRDAGGSWTPNPWAWGVGGLLLPVLGLATVSASLMVPIGVVYLWRRFDRDATAPAPDSLDTVDVTDTTDNGIDLGASGRGDDTEAGEVDADTGYDRPISRWWYGVAGTVSLYAVFAVVAALVTGPFNPVGVTPGSTSAVVSLVGGLYLVVSILFLFVTAPIFAVCLWLDAKRLREADVWQPNRLLVGALAVTHLSTMVVSLAMLVTVPGAIGYLLFRWRRVGLFA